MELVEDLAGRFLGCGSDSISGNSCDCIAEYRCSGLTRLESVCRVACWSWFDSSSRIRFINRRSTVGGGGREVVGALVGSVDVEAGAGGWGGDPVMEYTWLRSGRRIISSPVFVCRKMFGSWAREDEVSKRGSRGVAVLGGKE